MKQALKELIEKADFCAEGIFNEFLIIPTHKAYNGFWGKNGYENMIVLARSFYEKSWHRISLDDCDVFDLLKVNSVGIDIPCEYGCVRISSQQNIEILSPTSSIRGYGIKE